MAPRREVLGDTPGAIDELDVERRRIASRGWVYKSEGAGAGAATLLERVASRILIEGKPTLSHNKPCASDGESRLARSP